MRGLTWAVAALVVVGVGAGATPASAASNAADGRCIQEAAQAGLLSGDINPGTVNFVGGTDGNDNFTAQVTDGVDVICGFGGADTVDTLTSGDIFLGGDGNDTVNWMYGGTVNGGDGNDTVRVLYDGTFNGGAGDDYVIVVLGGGTFNQD